MPRQRVTYADEILEAIHGARLDSLPTPERDRLAAAEFGEGSFAFEAYRRCGFDSRSPLIRQPLVRRLAAQVDASTSQATASGGGNAGATSHRVRDG